MTTKTKRSFWAEDPAWEAAKRRAQRKGIPLSRVLNKYLRRYGNEQ